MRKRDFFCFKCGKQLQNKKLNVLFCNCCNKFFLFYKSKENKNDTISELKYDPVEFFGKELIN